MPRGHRSFPTILFPNTRCPSCGAPWEPICPTVNCDGRKTPLAIEVAEKRELGDRRNWTHVNPANLGSGVKEPPHWSGPRVVRLMKVTPPDQFREELDQAKDAA